jgi:uncharacterized protein (DUF1330 family)
MNVISKLIFAGLAGAAFGALAVSALQAQAKPPAYLIAEVEVTDAATYKTYTDGVNPIIASSGGKFVVRGGKTISLAGDPPKRVAISVFESMDKAEAFQNDPGYKALVPIREKSSKYRAYAVEGAAN